MYNIIIMIIIIMIFSLSIYDILHFWGAEQPLGENEVEWTWKAETR